MVQVPCIQFIDKTTVNFTVRNFVTIVRSGSSDHCYSQIGRVGGEQLLGLNLGCVSQDGSGRDTVQVVVHELMHALGKFDRNRRGVMEPFIQASRMSRVDLTEIKI